MNSNAPPQYLIFGRLERLYLLPPHGPPKLDVPGGNVLYAASGLSLWEENIGLVARVGEDYPRNWIKQFQTHKFDTRGIRIIPKALDLRNFFAYTDMQTRHTDNPIAHFARLEQPFPKALFGYRDSRGQLDSRTQLAPQSVRQADLPPDYMHATAAHFCAIDYLTHSFIPAILRQAGFTTLTLSPGNGYMNPAFWDLVPSIITGLTAFLPSENQIRSLFQGRSTDLREMMEALAAYGCEIIVVKRGLQGQLLYDAGSKTHWDIPAYPSRETDPTGAGDAFSGGFLAGYRRTYEPLEAVLHGSVSASLTIEGSGPFFALGALPGLAAARRDVLRQSAQKI